MAPPPTFWQNVISSIWAPGTYAKVAFILATMPLWKPTAQGMWKEIKKVLFAEPGTLTPPAPHEDPFLNIPLAAYRASRRPGAGGSIGANAGARSRPGTARRTAGRRTGF